MLKFLMSMLQRTIKEKKGFEYYIHFQGWNKSWDRWVLEDQILNISETNRGLQSKLYENAKKKKKSRKRGDDSSDDDKSEGSDSSGSSSNSDDVKTSQLPLVSIDIPKTLAVRLEDDCYNIKRKKKLIHLPRTPTVNDILNDFYAHCVEIVRTPEGKDIHLNLVSEVIFGLNTYFNFYIFSMLLYNFERDQYHKFFPPGKENQPAKLTSPVTTPVKNKISLNPAKLTNSQRSLKPSSNSIFEDSKASPLLKETLKSNARRKKSCVDIIEGSPSKRRRNASSASTSSDTKESSQNDNVFEEPKLEMNGKTSNRTIDLSMQKVSLENGNTYENELAKCVSHMENDHIKTGIKPNNYSHNEPLSSLENNCNGLRRSVRSQKSSSTGDNNEQDSLPMGSTAKTLQTTRQRKQRNCRNSKDLLHDREPDEKSFIEYPQNTSGNTPADIYGLEHLLRLFVKLPILLSCTCVEEQKMTLIVQYVTKFLDYLSKRPDLFIDQAIVYSESII